MYLSLKQSSTSGGMHEQSKSCWEIPPIFWGFMSNELKHTGQTLYPNPKDLFFFQMAWLKQHMSVFIYKVNQDIT
jgi:hypothetical protein